MSPFSLGDRALGFELALIGTNYMILGKTFLFLDFSSTNIRM